jgi:micrococcal nuclease
MAGTGVFLLAAAGMLALALSPAGAGEPLRWEGPVAVTEVLAGDLLRLSDGRAVRLAGIRVLSVDAEQAGAEPFAGQARAELRRLLDGQAIRLAPAEAPHDRYGRLVAHIARSDGLWLQGALLEQGLAQVQTRPGEAARAAEMLALEQTARAAGRGLWAEAAFMPQDPGALDDSTGRFRIVRGRVLRVAPTEGYVYLNFGADWRADFTVRVRRTELEGLLAGTALEGLAGRLVEVRGVVLQAGGPLIELSHPEQMQVLP